MIRLLVALLALVAAGCGPRFEPAPRPLGGYPALVLNETAQVRLRGLTATLAAGTRLVAEGTIGGEAAFCGPALVLGVVERICFLRRDETCLIPDGVGPPTCLPPGIFRREWS